MNNAEVLIKFKGNTTDLDKKTNSAASNVTSKLGSAAKSMGVAFLKGATVAAGAMASMVAKGVTEYAKLEQAIGGVETLFKDSADTVIKNAEIAYKTAGVDANKYMEQVTSFSASLLQATAGDTVKAAKTADMAIIDMADNANKMGTSIDMIQNAYQGFAKQNYMMLDNLKLGYGGTRTEMLRLLADAEKISGIHYDISNLDDVYQAIHVIQGELGITGTTAKEAASTIQGSAASMKAAFTNFLSGAGGIEDVISTMETFGKNVMNAVIELAPKIIDGLVTLLNTIIDKLPSLIEKILPTLINGVISLAEGVVKALPKIIEVLAKILPKLLSEIYKGAVKIANELSKQLPTLVPMIVTAILDVLLTILDNVDLMIEAGIQLMVGLTEGIMNALPELISRLPEIIIKICSVLINQTPQLLSAVIRIIAALAEGLVKYSVEIVSRIPQIISSIITALKSALTSFVNVGKNMIEGLWNGIKGMKDWVINKVKSLGKSIVSGLKGALGIHSPSTEFALIGKFSVLGYTEALDKMQRDVQQQVAETFSLSPQLTGSMQNSFSPNVQVYNNVNIEQDPLGQMVSSIKTFSGGAKNDYNYGSGI